jgi:hypothetical protein
MAVLAVDLTTYANVRWSSEGSASFDDAQDALSEAESTKEEVDNDVRQNVRIE